MAHDSVTNSKPKKNPFTTLTEFELKGLVQALSTEEQNLLFEIKNIFSEHVKKNEGFFNDLFFVRFLRARQFDLKKTIYMLQKYFEWREEVKWDVLLQTDLSLIRDTVRLYYPHGYHGIDKLGRPIYLERLGHAHVSHLLANVTTEQLTHYYVQRYEYLVHVMMPAAQIKTGKCVEQLLTIVDLKDFTLSQLNHKLKALLTALSAVSQNYYPELLGKLLFINSSTLFSALWAIISTLVDAKTLSKVSVISSKTESKRRVLELVDEDQLPQFLGGTQPDDNWQEANFGPWSDPSILHELKTTRSFAPELLFKLEKF